MALDPRVEAVSAAAGAGPIAPRPKRAAPSLVNRDTAIALAIAVVVMAVYLRTLFPGLGGGGDAAKFQYLGGVLGTAHPPGYPLYVFISYLFSHLPFGSPAYRINVMSACFGAAASMLTYLILVRLRSHRLVAACAALGLAFDRYLWSKSVGAEVYSLGAALVALIVLLALRWAATGRDRDLYLTVGAFALSLGNHLTIAMVAPAVAIFVLMTRPRTVGARTIAVSAAICVAGLAQYLFIILRTLQGAPHVEARASNLAELFDVVRATKYSGDMFTYTARQLIVDRVPRLWSLIATDLNLAGLIFFFSGLIMIVVQRLKAGIFVLVAAAGILFLTLNVDADVEGFLAPALVLIWIVAGLGMQAAWSAARLAGWAGVAVTASAVLALPVLQLTRNYRPNDHHLRTYEIRYFDALFRMLDDRAVITQEAYSIDQLVLYKLIGEHAANGRTILLVPGDLQTVQQHAGAGYAVYAFSNRRQALEGLGLEFEPVQLYDRAPPGSSGVGEPIDMAPLPIFKAKRWTPCVGVGNLGWRDITDVAAGGRIVLHVDNYRPFDASAVFYAGSRTAGGDPALVLSQGPMAPAAALLTFRRDVPGDVARLTDALRRDEAPDPELWLRQPVVHRLELSVNDDGQFSRSIVALRERPTKAAVRARVDLNNPQRAIVCGWSGTDFFAGRQAERVPLGKSGDGFFGQGWLPPESSDAGDFRWIAGREAEVLVPLARTDAIQVRLRARTFDGAGTMVIAINGARLPPRAASPDWSVLAWDVPADRWLVGLNRMTIRVSPAAPAAARADDPSARTAAIIELAFEVKGPAKE